ncbi:MAG: ATP-binding cassette domain-containing protein [Ktedonobacteraceae bacterium]|nr:ATP-binding cassette domain-containing protein [Ktedonobacteraceae bacterium]MBV9713256.1 ATP-binding cassette domain-containing protein [Ktedonobacteraceae bacterium]
MTHFAIDARNLSLSFGSIQAINDLSLSINRGTVFGFLGANGAGKTTTIHREREIDSYTSRSCIFASSSSILAICCRRLRARSILAASSSSAGTSGGTGVGRLFSFRAT